MDMTFTVVCYLSCEINTLYKQISHSMKNVEKNCLFLKYALENVQQLSEGKPCRICS